MAIAGVGLRQAPGVGAGRRVTLSIDPDVAGEQLPEVIGGREIARRWAVVVLASQLTDVQLDLTVAELLEGRRAA